MIEPSDWVVVVDDGSDSLASEVTRILRARGDEVECVPAGELARRRISVERSRAYFDGRPVRAVFFRARPDGPFAEGFVEEDLYFSCNEARSAWLALLQLPSVSTVNRPDAELWYSSSEWSVWYRRLKAAGVPMADLVVGDLADGAGDWTWLPWGGGVAAAPGAMTRRTFATALTSARAQSRSLWCCGEILDGAAGASVEAAAKVLCNYGVGLAGIFTDDDSHVVSCTTHPGVPGGLAHVTANRIAEVLSADLHSR